MATTYTTIDGDMLDMLCQRVYGRHRDTAEAVLAANRGLAAYGAKLPAGVTIILPDLPKASAASQPKKLWG